MVTILQISLAVIKSIKIKFIVMMNPTRNNINTTMLHYFFINNPKVPNSVHINIIHNSFPSIPNNLTDEKSSDIKLNCDLRSTSNHYIILTGGLLKGPHQLFTSACDIYF